MAVAKRIWESLHAVYLLSLVSTSKTLRSHAGMSLFEFNPASQVYMTREPVVYVCDTRVTPINIAQSSGIGQVWTVSVPDVPRNVRQVPWMF